MLSALLIRTVICVYFAMTLALFSCCASGADAAAGNSAPVARQGVLDLGAWDFRENGAVDLNGEWEFYWKQLLVPDDFHRANAPNGKTFLALPAAWNGVRLNGQKLGGDGFATFRLRILPGPEKRELALHLDDLYSAYRLWSNGRLIVESGLVGKDVSAEVPSQSVRQPRLTIGDQPLELVLQISNHHYREGGIVSPIKLGTAEQLAAAQIRQWGVAMFCIGSLAVMGIYHIALFCFRRKNSAPLYFGIYCLLWMGYFLTSNSNGWVASLYFAKIPVQFLIRVDLICFVLSVPVIYSFLRTLYPGEFSPGLQQITWALAAIFAALGIAAPAMAFTSVIPAYYIFSIVLILYSLVMLFMAMRRKREGASFILLGFLALGLAGTNDMLHDLQLISSVYMFRTGMFAFILFQACALSIRFSQAFSTVEQLSGEREEHILALSRMDRLKDEFLANTSHELRTPLNGIIGLAESLSAGAAGQLSEQARASLEMISGSGRRLNNLVNDILDLSRLKNRDIQLHRKNVDLHALAATVLTVSEPLVHGRRLTLINAVSRRVPLVDGDEDRLQQVLFNLVGNAIKFTDQGEVTISATAGNSEIEISVRDTGIGIPPDKLESIFNAFEQVDSSAARNHGGVGLGLGISRQLIELHGGRLWAEALPGSGSLFRFTLPLTAPDTEPAAIDDRGHDELPVPVTVPTFSAAPAALTPPSANAPRILAVDDDPVNLQVVKNQLRLEGMEVITAANGREALALIESGEIFHLILLDMMMPGMTGFELCRKLRKRYNSAELPVIMLTAKNRIADLTEGLECGANDYLGKPFAREELLARVRAQLKVREAHETALENSRLCREMELRAQTEAELRLTQCRLTGMLNTVQEPIIAINESSEIAFCNRVFEESFCYGVDELLGQPFERLFGASTEVPQKWLNVLDKSGADLAGAGEILEMITSDGRRWSGRVIPAALELEDERLLVLMLGESQVVTPSLLWIEDLLQNRRRLQQMEETLNGLTPLVLERHPGFIEDLRLVDRSLERMSRELTPELPEQDQRRLIVDAMKLALELWSEATGTAKADLARLSGQWAVYVNLDGWERTQTLDRYLSIDTLPAKPRLKKVLCTGDFVLSSAHGDTPQRQRLATALDHLRNG